MRYKNYIQQLLSEYVLVIRRLRWRNGELILCISTLFRSDIVEDKFCFMVVVQLEWCHCCCTSRILPVQYLTGPVILIRGFSLFYWVILTNFKEEYLKYATTCSSTNLRFINYRRYSLKRNISSSLLPAVRHAGK